MLSDCCTVIVGEWAEMGQAMLVIKCSPVTDSHARTQVQQ